MEPNIEVAILLNEAGWLVSLIRCQILVMLTLFISRYQHERGNSHNIGPFLNFAMEICSKIPTKQARNLLCDIHHTLAAVANESNNRVECEEHSRKNLELRVQAVEEGEPHDLSLGIAYNQRGIGLMMNNRYHEAEEHFKEGINICEGLPKFWKGMVSFTIANLGLSYWLQGDLETAYDALLQGLRDREKLFGIDDTESVR
jgi:tetratricopeptide (TPR) repeat protein